WSEFAKPLAIQLAKHELPRYKSGDKAGQYRVKTLKLESGNWKFTKTGGWSIFDFDLVKEQVKKDGVEKHSDYAEETVKVDYQKILKALKDGKLGQEFPGTKQEQENPLGK